MNVLVALVLLAGAFALGFGLGRRSRQVRFRSGRTGGSVVRITQRAARPTLRVIPGGRVRRPAGG